MHFLLALGIPIPFGMLLVGPWLMDLLFGPEIAAYQWVLVGLSALVPFRFMSILFGMTLTSADAQWRRVMAAGSSLVVLTVLDVLLLPVIGIPAALIGMAAATVLVAAVYATGVWRILGTLSLTGPIARALLAAAVAVGIGLAVRAIAPDPLAGIAFGVVYLGAIYGISRLAGQTALPLLRSEP